MIFLPYACVNISLLNLHVLPTHFNLMDVLGNNSFESAMPEVSGGITSEINILRKNDNQSARNNCRTIFEVS